MAELKHADPALPWRASVIQIEEGLSTAQRAEDRNCLNVFRLFLVAAFLLSPMFFLSSKSGEHRAISLLVAFASSFFFAATFFDPEFWCRSKDDEVRKKAFAQYDHWQARLLKLRKAGYTDEESDIVLRDETANPPPPPRAPGPDFPTLLAAGVIAGTIASRKN